MAQPFLGDIEVFGFNFAPVGWLQCNGQLVQISQYEALYNLLGTTYGGDGVSTFGVPNLLGRAAVHFGQGTGLANYPMGQMGGSEGVTVLTTQLPSHSHQVQAVSAAGTTNVPTNNLWAKEASGTQIYSTGPANTTMSNLSLQPDGGSGPHENRSPFLAINYCICTEGIYPPQS